MRRARGPAFALLVIMSLAGCTAAPADPTASPSASAITQAASDSAAPSTTAAASTFGDDVTALEAQAGVTVAISAVNLATGESVQHRSSDPVPMCSLFKVIAVGALLQAHAYDEQYLDTPVPFTADQIVVNSPVASKLTTLQMTPNEMADAALRYSDNTAGNLLLDQIGGPAAIGQLAQQLGATSTRLDRAEPELNEGTPGDLRDTTTADDMVTILRALLIDGDAGQLTQSKLQDWMLQNTTSSARARAGLSGTYALADKTGAGGYGVVNDAGVLWQGDSGPIVFSILTRTGDPDAANDNDVVAQAMRLVVSELQ